MNVAVIYDRVVDLEAARRCVRCAGTGRERYVPGTCPRCEGTGIRANGWLYDAGGLDVAVGDTVEVPRTPRTTGPGPQFATVVDVDVPSAHSPRCAVIRVVREG